MRDPESLAIESVAFDAWPAAEVAALGGWRLRFNHGITNRGSSVWPGPGASELPLDARIDAVERFYAERGAAASYQLSPASDPPGARRRARGARLRGSPPVSVELASAAEVAALAAPRGVEAPCSDALSEEWFDAVRPARALRGEAVPVYRALLERLPDARASRWCGPAAQVARSVSPWRRRPGRACSRC